jgi:hypothetical protein
MTSLLITSYASLILPLVSQTKLPGKYMQQAYNTTLPGDHAIYSTYPAWLNKQVKAYKISSRHKHRLICRVTRNNVSLHVYKVK